MGHAGQEIFIHIYKEKTSFVFINYVLLPENTLKAHRFTQRAPRVPMLRGSEKVVKLKSKGGDPAAAVMCSGERLLHFECNI
jgi:hypothetical protein